MASRAVSSRLLLPARRAAPTRSSRILSALGSRVQRTYATETSSSNFVNIVEVGPRDGLQNEKSVIPPETKIELINRLGRAGMKIIEAGSFVSPKWVPQMAGTAEVATKIEKLPGVTYQYLVPNEKGLSTFLNLLSQEPDVRPGSEIAIFTAATDAFSKANTNVTVAEARGRKFVARADQERKEDEMVDIGGLSSRYSDMTEAERDGDEKWNTGAGIMERLGGRAVGRRVPPGVSQRGPTLERPEVETAEDENEGESARCISDVDCSSSSSQPASDPERQWSEGPGIFVGVCGRGRDVP
ncbi:hypothetical protein EWM64_g10082 [Hericium alpestre]|uniref:hydroxymethylglutaryl-CoA lyase n=1 Tax=Hericium alpestre TaxID=135208 RepID=A0A4Y9ZKH3_9AGAM|nr:hypothetical protein EWM64_g10082 [Hericium alpestre]